MVGKSKKRKEALICPECETVHIKPGLLYCTIDGATLIRCDLNEGSVVEQVVKKLLDDCVDTVANSLDINDDQMRSYPPNVDMEQEDSWDLYLHQQLASLLEQTEQTASNSNSRNGWFSSGFAGRELFANLTRNVRNVFQIGTQNDLSSINERDLSRLLESNNIQSSSLIDLIIHIIHRSSNDSDFEEKQKRVISRLVDNLGKRISNERNIYSKLKDLLDLYSCKFPYEVNVVLEIIQLTTAHFSSRQQSEFGASDRDSHSRYQSQNDPKFNELIDTILDWLKFIFSNTSVLANYGLAEPEIYKQPTNKGIKRKMHQNDASSSSSRRNLNKSVVINEAFVFNALIKIKSRSDQFKKIISDFFEERYKRDDISYLVQIRSQFDFSQYRELLAYFDDFIINVAFEKPANIHVLYEMLKNRDMRLFKSYLCFLLDSYGMQNEESDVETALNSPIFIEALKCLKQQKSIEHILNDKWLRNFKQLESVLTESLNSIIKGDEKVRKIRLFDRKLNIIKEILPQSDKHTDLIKHRCREIESIESMRTSLQAFLQIFLRVKKINIEAYQKRISALSDLNELELNKLCEPTKPGAGARVTNVKCFDQINTNDFATINRINELDKLKSVMFFTYLDDSCKEINSNTIDLRTVLDRVLPATLEKWKTLSKSIETGNIKLAEIDKYLEWKFKNNSKKLTDEFLYICRKNFTTGEDNLAKRSNQIDMYIKFKSSLKAADLLNQIRAKYQLKGKFNEIDNIIETKLALQDQNWTLDRMNKSLEEPIRALNSLNTADRIQCLDAFLQAHDLVMWLRKNTKNIKEFKFLVDVILTSKSNEHAQLSASTKHAFAITLKDACVGYAGLIYDLNPDKDDFTALIRLFDKLWLNLRDDSKIGHKLISVKDNSSVLQSIKQKIANAEMGSIEQAKQININGVYKIGLDNKNKTPNIDTLESWIRLEADFVKILDSSSGSSGHPPKCEKRTFTYEELNELKSMIMLLAKRPTTLDSQDDEIPNLEYFIEVFDNVVRLTETFRLLINKGCTLFENFELAVYSDFKKMRMSQHQPLVRFQLNADFLSAPIQLEYRNETVEICLKNLCQLIEKSFTQWISHIEVTRNTYTWINLFTTKQVNFLRSELSNFLIKNFDLENSDTFTWNQLKSMLFNLVPNEMFDKNYLHDAYVQILAQQRQARSSLDPSLVEFVKDYALRNQFNEALVYQAIKIYGTEDIDGINEFCILNDTEMESLQDEVVKMETNQIQPIEIQVLPNGTFVEKLDHVFSEFMRIEKGEKESNCSFTLERLAIYLEKLRALTDAMYLNTRARDIPGYLVHRGRPNLVVCPRIDQIPIALSIYASSPKQPLPSNDECLFCSSETISEEVENFFRIAFKSNGESIYTILGLQELRYDTLLQVEKFLLNSNLKSTDTYVLVCICSEDQPDRNANQITSLLHKNRINPIILPRETLEAYLNEKLKDTRGENQLASKDPSKSTIRVLFSHQSGNGKSTYVTLMREKFNICGIKHDLETLRIKNSTLNLDEQLNKLFEIRKKAKFQSVVFHIDIANETFFNVDLFLFNLAILGYLKHSNGQVWRRQVKSDLYYIEIMPLFLSRGQCYHSTVDYLPRIEFRSPSKYLYDLVNELPENENLKSDHIFNNYFAQDKYQRPCAYLYLHNIQPEKLETFKYESNRSEIMSSIDCLKILLEQTRLVNPSWAEINNFVHFLNEQLYILERSKITNEPKELRVVYIKIIIMMAYDFGLPSLNISRDAEVFTVNQENRLEIRLDRLELVRKWENMAHPYILFNNDQETLTFMGIYLDRRTYKFINPNTNEPLEGEFIKFSAQLRIELLKQKIPIYDNFNELPRTKKINTLRYVMGLDYGGLLHHDPDQTYELTVDNCLKLMAIFLRLRCNHPVVIMGETGCGKTRKVKFFSDLHVPPKSKNFKHLIHFKIHGGTTEEELELKVRKAERLSYVNMTKLQEIRTLTTSSASSSKAPITALLFLDEANTTEAIGLIKEIMCDSTCRGRPIDFSKGLKIIAAVNPYRKHSDEMIGKLEEAGLGYFISATDSKERFGHIPMRQLVYRVQPLPAAMLPLVWDFGQLDSHTEAVYIEQMLDKMQRSALERFQITDADKAVMKRMLVETQTFMRSKRDECSFVSLRDIERVLQVTVWFISKKDILFPKMDLRQLEREAETRYQENLAPLIRSFVLALAVCYHASLYSNQIRQEYRNLVRRTIRLPNASPQQDWVKCEILKCQHVFLDEIVLSSNIARNHALLENVFMIIVCLELRIPLFIVGKPGSSKSLAKSIVEASMIGVNSSSPLFKNLKESFFVNFQCSPLTQAKMIKEAFKEAALFQENKELDKSVAVVNLDEIGLAEGSESMPLKILHPLLEDGLLQDEDEAQAPQSNHKKVGFIGISNWALDPAKMNRGIFVSRGEPDIQELIESAKGICKYDENIYKSLEPFIDEIAQAYLEVCSQAKEFKREFFGLRDFYSLIKMLYCFCSRDGCLTWPKLEHSIRRNFSGLEIDTLKPFRERLQAKIDPRQLDTDPKCGPIDLIHSALKGENVESNSRYLLLLTENYAIIDMVQNYLSNVLRVDQRKITVVFGSSFSNDLKYTEVCKNISKIKQSMEIGNTVILLNFQNLYESLYDALNQYYYELGGDKYVYLGINTHRIQCRVNEDFRLIIISDKASVYDSKRFPIPLINRLEKHFLNSLSILNPKELELMNRLEDWAKTEFGLKSRSQTRRLHLNEIFIGYHDDTLATLILNSSQGKFNYLNSQSENKENLDDEIVLNRAKELLIRCATADSIIRSNKESLWSIYFQKQCHSTIQDLIGNHIREAGVNQHLLQISTHSKMPMTRPSLDLMTEQLQVTSIESCLLHSFETQQQFSERVKRFLRSPKNEKRLMIIQCDFSKKYDSDLLSCVRYTIAELYKEAGFSPDTPIYVCIVLLLARETSHQFVGYQISQWSCYHIDDLDESNNSYLNATFYDLKSKSLSQLIGELKMNEFMQAITHQACSLIKDTKIQRTIERIQLFTHLYDQDEEFLKAFIKRLVKIQTFKEETYMTREIARNWLVKEVADLRQINEFSTLRKSCLSNIEAKLTPIVAFLLSRIDLYNNLDLIYDKTNRVSSQLWLAVFDDEELFKTSYEEMRSDDAQRKEFECKQWPSSARSEHLKAKLPFFWLLVNKLGDLCDIFFQSTNDRAIFLRTVPELFEATAHYKLFKQFASTSLNLFDSYINDFLLLKSDVRDHFQMEILKALLKSRVEDQSEIRTRLPLIHYEFEQMRTRIETYLKFSDYNPDINQKLNKLADYSTLDLDSCLEAIKLFERDYEKSIDFEANRIKIEHLISMIRNLISSMSTDNSSPKYADICRKYNLFRFYQLFLSDVVLKELSRKSLESLFNEIISWLKVKLIKDSAKFCFKSNIASVDLLNEICTKTWKRARFELTNAGAKCKCCGMVKSDFRAYFSSDCECRVCADCELLSRSRTANGKTVCVVCNREIRLVDRKFNVAAPNGQISIALDQIPSNKQILDELVRCLNNFYLNTTERLVFEKSWSSRTNDINTKLVESIMQTVINASIRHEMTESVPIEASCRLRLLQMLFRNHDSMVGQSLAKYFDRSDRSLTNVFGTSKQMAVFFTSCVQEMYVDRARSDELLVACSITRELLADARVVETIRSTDNSFSVDRLVTLAQLKFVIKVLAKCVYSQEAIDQLDNRLLETFLDSMRQVVEPSLQYTTTVFCYLIKELIRKFGNASVKFIKANEHIKWIVPTKIIGENLHVNDRYILAGDVYKRLRSGLTKCFEERSGNSLEEECMKSMKIIPNQEMLFAYVVMALYKNVSTLYKDMNQVPTEFIEKALAKQFPRHRHHWEAFLANRLMHNLKISQENWPHIELSLLLVQLKFSILCSRSKLAKPLASLIETPARHVNSYLPCMPQDMMFDIHQAVRAGVRAGVENPTFYMCPNNHPYVLFNCGRPWEVFNCRVCGAKIGGRNHNLEENNRVLTVEDTTMRGYCLAPAANFPDNPAHERELNAIGFHLERFIIHACLYFACDRSEKEVGDIMSQNQPNKVEFFWDHMLKDLKIASKSLNLNQDEVITLLHSICIEILHGHFDAQAIDLWIGKNERQQWESQFYTAFLSKKLKEPNKIITEASNLLKTETSNEDDQSKKLYFMAYELIGEDKEKEKFIYEDLDFWKYQPEVNMEILDLELRNRTQQEQHMILKKFLELKYNLELVKHLPEMINFIKYPLNNQKFRFYKHFASKKTIRELLFGVNDQDEEPIFPKSWNKEKFEKILGSFQTVWLNCKHNLANYIKQTLPNVNPALFLATATSDFQFSLNTNLSVFLPTLNGDGLISYVLIHYLSKIQNEMLKFYHQYKRIKSCEQVEPMSIVNKDYIINIESENELVRIVQSNFSFNSVHSTFVFQYESISERIVERYFQAKPLIDLNKIPLYEYADEISDLNMFSRLDDVIRQQPIEQSVQANIFNEFGTINDVAEALNVLKTVINYARTTSADSNEILKDFMAKIYLKDAYTNSEHVLKNTIVNCCRTKHLRHISLILMMRKAFLYTICGLNPFENLNLVFRDECKDEEIELEVATTPALILSFALVLYQLISRSSNFAEEDINIISTQKIRDIFQTLESLNIVNPVENVEKLSELVPSQIQMKLIFSLWKKITTIIETFN